LPETRDRIAWPMTSRTGTTPSSVGAASGRAATTPSGADVTVFDV